MKDYDDIDFVIRSKIRDVLVECRKERRITQKELADTFGVKPTTVASWEQGLSLPSVSTLYRLAMYYEKTLEYMYGMKEDKENGKS